MNKLYSILILTICSLNNSYAENKGPLYRDYRVTNQPMPSSLLWKQDIVSEPVNFNSRDNPGNNDEIHHKQGLIELFPILTSDYEDSLTSPGFGIIGDNFNNIQNVEISDYYSGAYLSFFGIGQINKNWYTSGLLSYGNFSNKKVKFNSNTDKTFVFLNFGYNHSDNLIYKFGVLYNSNFGDNVVLPTLGLSYSWNSWVLDSILPSYINLRYLHSKTLHTVIGTEVKYSSYYDSNKNDALEISGVDFDIHAEYNFYEMFWLHTGVVFAGEKDLEWINTETKIATIDSGLKFNAGIIARY